MIIFSNIVCRADTTSSVASGLVGGEPICYDDLAGWTVFEDFLKECPGHSNITVEVTTYGYGEGPDCWDATPEEVAYMMKRIEMRPDFLEARCTKTRMPYKVSISWEATEPVINSPTLRKAGVSLSERVTAPVGYARKLHKDRLGQCPKCGSDNLPKTNNGFPRYDEVREVLTKLYVCHSCHTEFYEKFSLTYTGCIACITTDTEDGMELVNFDSQGNKVS